MSTFSPLQLLHFPAMSNSTKRAVISRGDEIVTPEDETVNKTSGITFSKSWQLFSITDIF